MRIGRLTVGPSARSHDGPPREPDNTGRVMAVTRVVRRMRTGREAARIDLRYEATGELTVVTLSSQTTEPLSVAAIGRVLDMYPGSARHPVVFRTPAITRDEALSYHRHGFVTKSVLTLLTRDLTVETSAPVSELRSGPPGITLRRGRSHHLAACAAVDRSSFGPENCFDEHDLVAALDATDRSRLRLATDATGTVLGFVVAGRAGTRGYLQRLAVDPKWSGNGIGSALILDALRWCRRRGVRRTVVNTQSDNRRALDLYRRLGFVDMALDLVLLERCDHPSK